jgi:hypothetical protein
MTNLMGLAKHGGARYIKFLVTDPLTDLCERCLTIAIALECTDRAAIELLTLVYVTRTTSGIHLQSRAEV